MGATEPGRLVGTVEMGAVERPHFSTGSHGGHRPPTRRLARKGMVDPFFLP